MKERLDRLRRILIVEKLGALFVTDQANVTYLTGFAGLSPHEREGFLFVTKKDAYLLTFPTYFGLYKKGSDSFKTVNITPVHRLTDYLNEITQGQKIKHVGVEKENLTLSEMESLKAKTEFEFRETAGLVEKLREIKDEEEIGYISQAAAITDDAFEFIKTKIRKGATEHGLALELEFFIKKKADDIAFSPIVAFDENAAIPHYLPNKKQITNNNLILLDFGAKIHGYCSDMTRVVFWGSPKNDKIVTIFQTVLSAQEAAMSHLRIGKTGHEIDIIAKEIIKNAGFPEYLHGLGHGVGLNIHEAPRLKKDSPDIMTKNMVVTVEPGIYIEGFAGTRIEDLVVLKEDGIEILSKSDKTLQII
ncbi:MAG: Xaa-Pro peptidase family protein [Patescibacteria group bacterium]|nr:Xaa-Pro peptidase family protein [Patescibacteria group bacterium]